MNWSKVKTHGLPQPLEITVAGCVSRTMSEQEVSNMAFPEFAMLSLVSQGHLLHALCLFLFIVCQLSYLVCTVRPDVVCSYMQRSLGGIC